MAITSVANYKTYRGISGTGLDAALAVIHPAVEEMLARHTGRTFEETTHTDEEYDGDGSQILHLKSWPVTTLTSVKYRDSGGTSTALASSSYRLKSDRGRVTRLPFAHPSRFTSDSYGSVYDSGWGAYPCFTEGYGNYLVTYTAGYAEGEFPVELLHAIYQAIDVFVSQVGIDLTIQSETEGSYSYTRADVNMILAPYKAELFRPFTADGGVFC